MLRHLRVTNFAILSDVEIELGPGMNVLTGETGAGKSLIVEAVKLLRGGRASADGSGGQWASPGRIASSRMAATKSSYVMPA